MNEKSSPMVEQPGYRSEISRKQATKLETISNTLKAIFKPARDIEELSHRDAQVEAKKIFNVRRDEVEKLNIEWSNTNPLRISQQDYQNKIAELNAMGASKDILDFEYHLQALETMFILNEINSLSPEERRRIEEEVAAAMTNSDTVFSKKTPNQEKDGRKISELNSAITAMSHVYNLGMMVVDGADQVKFSETNGITQVDGQVWGSEQHLKLSAKGEILVDQLIPINDDNETTLDQNIAGIYAAEAVANLAKAFGVEDYRSLFDMSSQESINKMIDLVKGFCEWLLSGLEDNNFRQLDVKKQQIFAFSLLMANGTWKVGVEDVANQKGDVSRISRNNFGTFMQMLENKGWKEVAKDMFQIAQGLAQLDKYGDKLTSQLSYVVSDEVAVMPRAKAPSDAVAV